MTMVNSGLKGLNTVSDMLSYILIYTTNRTKEAKRVSSIVNLSSNYYVPVMS